MFKKLITYTPLYTAILIFLGFINLHYYYKYFNINIYDFINISELITSFFPILINVFAVILFLLIPYILQLLLDLEKRTSQEVENAKATFEPKKQLEKLKKIYSKENLKKRRWYTIIPYVIFAPSALIFSILYYVFTIGGLFLIVYSVYNYPHELYTYQGILIFLFIFVYILFIQKGVDKLEKKFNDMLKTDTSIFMLVIQIIIIFLIFNVFSNYASSQKVLGGKPEYVVTFNYKDSSYISDNKFVFIGQTQNYIFFQDIPTGINYIFPINGISKLQMKKYN